MNIWKRTVAILLMGASIALGAAGVAAAREVTYVGGGTWYHGLTSARVYSNYFHSTRCHGSTAEGTYTYRSATVAAGYTSEASAPRALYNNKTYWRTC
ncbi:lactococcin 972 family bacteriocin [Nocardiopsis aegyptia]|uniref:lactococcin 972 family bacteriocin n=1 Tax=Nocardiopsis aegyptia TaxID=220378 RepID=UPI00366D87D2